MARLPLDERLDVLGKADFADRMDGLGAWEALPWHGTYGDAVDKLIGWNDAEREGDIDPVIYEPEPQESGTSG